jgi:soluble lytic murein transglycosylase-like protein
MNLPDQIQFQGSAESKGFNPITPASPTRALEADANRLSQSWQEVAGQQLEQQKRTINFNDQQTQYNVQALAGFSQTLGKHLEEQKDAKNEAERAEAENLAYELDLTPERMAKFNAMEEQLKATDSGIQTFADSVQAGGADYLAIQKIRNLSGWGKYGLAMGMAKKLGSEWGGWVENAMSSDRSTEITVDGRKFFPADAQTAPERAAALAALRAKYLKDTGLSSLSQELQNKYAWSQMRESDAQMLNNWRQEDVRKAQDASVDETLATFEASKVQGFNIAMDNLVRSGKYTRLQARKELLSRVANADDIDSIGNSESWQKGKTWNQLYESEFRLAKQAAIAGENQEYNANKSALELDGKKWFEQVQEEWEKNPPSAEAIEQAKIKMQDDFDFIDPRLERWTNRSTNATLAKELSDKFDRLDRAGLLTKGMLDDPSVPGTVRKEFLNRAEAYDKARNDTPEFKKYTKQLEGDVERLVGENVAGNPKNVPGLELAKSDATARFQALYLRSLQGGAVLPAQAAANAYAAIKQEIDLGATKKGRYAVDDFSGFTNSAIVPKGTSTAWEKHKIAIDEKTKIGDTALDRFALIPAAILQEAIRDSNSPNYQTPAIATYISQRLGGRISPWEVLNRQAQAQKLGSLEVPPALKVAQGTMSPNFLRLLTYKPSARRVNRAYASIGTFNTSLIPNGYGTLVQQAASANRIDPAILAGLLETESNWRTDSVSTKGAQGIAQFVPATAREWGVDVTNAGSSIQGAAKYLAYLRDYFNGDLNKAIYAYNGGMGNIAKYGGPIPHSAENKGYLNKVLLNAAKYGYGSPGGQPWSNAAILNPKVAYVTGNIGPTSTGPHLDVKQTDGGLFDYKALDNYVEVEDKGRRVPLSSVPVTETQAGHRARGSHGIDYGTYSGSKVYLKGGVRIVKPAQRTEHGDLLTIQLPNGKQYTFLHGKSV